ncbi:MAG: hypothetical protein NW224_21945 [Leptolyngbyaceae cyanobacterium bins.302]|nr:hypothetical protein [Leptolyngbyaceae cyanobacterium bins.302]
MHTDRRERSGVAQAIIERGEFTRIIRGYERYGLFFTESIGYRMSPEDGSSTPLFYGEVKINTLPSRVLDPAKSEWNFVEVWIDPMLSHPYLLLLGDPI